MFHQLFRTLILLMRADIYPRAIKRISYDLLALGDELLYEMGGMEEGIFRNLGKNSLLDEVDASIGIVVVFRLFYQSLDVATIKVEDA